LDVYHLRFSAMTFVLCLEFLRIGTYLLTYNIFLIVAAYTLNQKIQKIIHRKLKHNWRYYNSINNSISIKHTNS